MWRRASGLAFWPFMGEGRDFDFRVFAVAEPFAPQSPFSQAFVKFAFVFAASQREDPAKKRLVWKVTGDVADSGRKVRRPPYFHPIQAY